MINSLVRPCASSKTWLLYPPFKRDAWMWDSCFKEVQMDGLVFPLSEFVIEARDVQWRMATEIPFQHCNPSQRCYIRGHFSSLILILHCPNINKSLDCLVLIPLCVSFTFDLHSLFPTLIFVLPSPSDPQQPQTNSGPRTPYVAPTSRNHRKLDIHLYL